MAFMGIEGMVLYFTAIILTSYVGVRILMFVENTEDLGINKIKRFIKVQSSDAAQQTEHAYTCPCLGYKIKRTCRHLPQ